MALKGSLEDLGVVDLVQFVHQTHKTGALVLNGAGGEARLYYRDGDLIDARLGGEAGLEVLVRTVDWSDGEFEFLQGAEAQAETIQMDLHRAVMNAVKIRDERKVEEEKQRSASKEQEVSPLTRQLQEGLASMDSLVDVCVLDASGQLLGEAHRSPDSAERFVGLRDCLHALAASYPRPDIRRVLIEDEGGTVVLARMPEDRALIAVAGKGTPPGIATVQVGRLMGRLAA